MKHKNTNKNSIEWQHETKENPNNAGRNSRWNNPHVSGLVAAVLLLAMLVTAALSSVGTARAGEEPIELAAAQTGSLKLAKEYVYAGSRMLAIEDYGIGSTPTPSPTSTPTATPTPPTPTPTPTISSCPAGSSSLDGVITGNPTATVFNNTLFVFVKGTDNAIYYRNSSNGSNFAAYVYLGGYLISDPATLVTYNTLYVEATGGDNQRYLRSTTDGVNFADWVVASVNAQTTPSAYFNGNTYTFVKGDGTQPPLCVNVTAGGTPTPTPTVTPTPPTPTPTPPLPGAPSGLRAEVISSTQINLYWDASPPSENVTGYNVRMNGSQVLTGFTYTSYPFTGLAPATSYTFEVAAVNSSGVSAWSQSVSATTQPQPKPDLVITSFSITPASPNAGDAVNFSTTFINQGNAATPNGFLSVHYYIDGDGSQGIYGGDTLSVAPGQSVTFSASSQNWAAVAGTHTLSAFVDDLNGVDESNETNNTAALTVNVAAPTPTPTPTPTPCNAPLRVKEECVFDGGTWDDSICDCVFP